MNRVYRKAGRIPADFMHDPPLESDPVQTPTRPSLSALAVVAVVLAFIPLCPPVNALGTVLGVIAWRRIRESGGRLGGRRLSLTAIIGGIVLSIGTLVLFQQLADMMDRQQQQDMGLALDGFIHAVEDGDVDTAMTWWATRDEPVSSEEVSSFGTELTEQFGPFKSVRIGSYETVPGDSLFNLQASCWIICSFQEGERNGSARFALKAMTDRYSLLPLLIELRIDLVDGKELVLPAEQESEDGT